MSLPCVLFQLYISVVVFKSRMYCTCWWFMVLLSKRLIYYVVKSQLCLFWACLTESCWRSIIASPIRVVFWVEEWMTISSSSCHDSPCSQCWRPPRQWDLWCVHHVGIRVGWRSQKGARKRKKKQQDKKQSATGFRLKSFQVRATVNNSLDTELWGRLFKLPSVKLLSYFVHNLMIIQQMCESLLWR